MRNANESRDPVMKESGLQLEPEEVGVVRVEGGVQNTFDCGKVDTIVFHARVVSHDNESQEREG